LPTNPVTTHTPREIQIHRIEKFLGYIFDPGDLVELRGLYTNAKGKDKVMRTLTRDYAIAAKVAVMMSKHGCNVYFCLNPINPERWYAKDCLRNFKDKCEMEAWRTAQADDITERNTYLIDVDAVKATGTASTKEQVAASQELATKIQAYLAERGWPEPIRLSSGNGTHLLYRGDRTSPKGSLWPVVLQHLSKTFSIEGEMTVDVKVANTARISRLPYILNRKAAREASVISYPHTFEPVGYNLIYSLSLEAPAHTAHRATGTSALLDEDFDVEDLIAEYPEQLFLDNVTPDGDLTYYSLSVCPIKGEAHHDQHVGKGHSCLIVGGPSGLGFSCLSSNCVATIADLLRLLHYKTGRWFSKQIWAEDYSRFPVEWADDGKPVWLDDATQLTRAAANPTADADADDEDEDEVEAIDVEPEPESIQPEPESIQPESVAITTAALESVFIQTVLCADDLVGRVSQPAQLEFRRFAERIAATHHHRAMRVALGEELIADLDEDVRLADAAPRYQDEDGSPTTTYLAIATRADHLARKLKGIP
jgi:hypothetical protein